MMVWCPCFLALGAFFVILLALLFVIRRPTAIKLNGANAIVTGGSKGIGKYMAIELIKAGANVTIIARNRGELEKTKEEIEKMKINATQKVLAISLDVSAEYGEVESAVKKSLEEIGACDILVNNAGISIAQPFDEIDIKEFKRLMEVNYLGAVSMTKAVLPHMKQQQRGRIVLVSSQAGQLGLFGYSAYSATKFALRGLAEALQMELKPYNIFLTISFPPDTDTPGYNLENEIKPKATHLISDTSGLFQAEDVARIIIRDTKNGRFQSSVGLDGFMLANLTCGMQPVSSVFDALTQIATMSVFRLISLFYLKSFDSIVKKCTTEDFVKDEKKQN